MLHNGFLVKSRGFNIIYHWELGGYKVKFGPDFILRKIIRINTGFLLITSDFSHTSFCIIFHLLYIYFHIASYKTAFFKGTIKNILFAVT